MKIGQATLQNNPMQQPQVSGAKPQANNNIRTPSDNMQILTDIYGEKTLKQMGVVECATCASRTYVDGSDDPGVSFKTPTNVSPEASASAVMGHEQEHVANERASAHAEGKQVVSQSVTLSNAICPECGKVYVAGGTTRTTTKTKSEPKQNYGIANSLTKGLKFNTKI